MSGFSIEQCPRLLWHSMMLVGFVRIRIDWCNLSLQGRLWAKKHDRISFANTVCGWVLTHCHSSLWLTTNATHFVEGFGFSDPPAEGWAAETWKNLPDPACFLLRKEKNNSLMWTWWWFLGTKKILQDEHGTWVAPQTNASKVSPNFRNFNKPITNPPKFVFFP